MFATILVGIAKQLVCSLSYAFFCKIDLFCKFLKIFLNIKKKFAIQKPRQCRSIKNLLSFRVCTVLYLSLNFFDQGPHRVREVQARTWTQHKTEIAQKRTQHFRRGLEKLAHLECLAIILFCNVFTLDYFF